MTLKAGDRVAIYSNTGRKTGVIEVVDHTSSLSFKIIVNDKEAIYAHAYQCRKLVRATKRRIWIDLKTPQYVPGTDISYATITHNNPASNSWVEFIEVIKKK